MPKRPKYSVTVEKIPKSWRKNWPGCKYSVSFDKTFGDLASYSTCVATKADIISQFSRVRESWESLDYILNRKGNKVTPRNLEFTDKTGDIVLEELFGLPLQHRLL